MGGPISGSWHAANQLIWRVPVMVPLTLAPPYPDLNEVELPVAEYQYMATLHAEYYLFIGMAW